MPLAGVGELDPQVVIHLTVGFDPDLITTDNDVRVCIDVTVQLLAPPGPARGDLTHTIPSNNPDGRHFGYSEEMSNDVMLGMMKTT